MNRAALKIAVGDCLRHYRSPQKSLARPHPVDVGCEMQGTGGHEFRQRRALDYLGHCFNTSSAALVKTLSSVPAA